MAEINFGSTVGMLKNAIDGAGLSHSVTANNIANANTPNFRRSNVSFKDALAATEGTPAEAGGLEMAVTDERHFAIGNAEPPKPFHIAPQLDETTQMRVDGSNVDVDQEMAKLSANSAYAGTMAQLLQVQFMRLRQAITERF